MLNYSDSVGIKPKPDIKPFVLSLQRSYNSRKTKKRKNKK